MVEFVLEDVLLVSSAAIESCLREKEKRLCSVRLFKPSRHSMKFCAHRKPAVHHCRVIATYIPGRCLKGLGHSQPTHVSRRKFKSAFTCTMLYLLHRLVGF